VKQCYKAEEDNHKKTKLAYVDIAPKAPRSIRNAQVYAIAKAQISLGDWG
jgi:hypothetical protein